LSGAAKDGTCAGTLSPNLVRTYLALASDLDYDLRPGQEGDEGKR